MDEIDSLDIFAAYKHSRPIDFEHNSYDMCIEEGELLDLSDISLLSLNLDKYKKV